jgi:hypothetical protein
VPAARRAFSQASAKAAFYLREHGTDRFIGQRVLREINLIGRISHVLQLRAQRSNTDKNTHSAVAILLLLLLVVRRRYFRHLCDEFFVCPFRPPPSSSHFACFMNYTSSINKNKFRKQGNK